jgi:hypothetical protein
MADLARVKAMKAVEAIFERYVGRGLMFLFWYFVVLLYP